jgi:hypothetical protein
LKQEKAKSENDYGHDEHEWGFDDSEETDWKKHYESRTRKWRIEIEQDIVEFESGQDILS